jgi:hypothetical protein
MDIDGAITRLGQARMAGTGTLPLQVEVPRKPKRVMLNHFQDILAQ